MTPTQKLLKLKSEDLKGQNLPTKGRIVKETLTANFNHFVTEVVRSFKLTIMIEKEELENLLKIKGEIRGVAFQTDAQYILAKEGEEGLKKLEKRVKELNLPIDYRRVSAMEWYPVGLRVISLLLIKDTFSWPDEEIRKMGQTAPKISFIVKFFFKLFLSVRKLVQEIPQYWKEHYRNIGEIEVVKLDEEKKEVVVRVTNFKVHPIYCKYLEGYFETVLALTREKGRVTSRETKCMFRDGTPFHEYLVTWE